MGKFVDIRPEERRATFAAFVSLLGITAGHTLLETARDALFLSKLPASRLPWVYLAIAAIGILAARLNRARAARAGAAGGRSGSSVAIALFVSAGITVAFWATSSLHTDAYLYALYIWVGIFASWVVVQFWMLLGERFTVVQAKRVYGLIGAGAVLGAVVGAAGARALAEWLPAQHLLLAASGLFVVTALGPVLALGSGERKPVRAGVSASGAGSLTADLRETIAHPYVRRILLLVLLGSIAVTAVDFVFKAEAAKHIAPADLGRFFSTVYVVLNGLALVVQLFAVGFVLRTFGVHRAVWILPLLLFAGAGGVIAGGGIIAAILLKGVDGSLRHSLNRTSTELLFVPLPDALRTRVKPFIDLIGQRGGQAVASLLILGAVALIGVGPEAVRHQSFALAIGIAILTAGCLVVAWGLRRHYLDLFRETLGAGRVDSSLDLPDLDLGALEALFAGLNSQKNAEVIGALELLAAQRRERLIPALILYHPSTAVVLRALEIFAREGRADFVPIAERLLTHADASVRAAALRARTAVQPEEAFLRARIEDACLEVRATAVVGMVSRGWLAGDEATAALAALLDAPAAAVRVALAKAIAAEPTESVEPVLEKLLRSSEPEVQLEACWAAGRTQNPRFLPILLPLLAERLQSSAARDAMLDIGAPALAFLDEALDDRLLADRVRWSIPRALGTFEPADAAPILLQHLSSQTDGMARYRILRALQRLRAIEPELELDAAILARTVEDTLRGAVRNLAYRVTLERTAAATPTHATPGRDLLHTILRDKEVHAVARMFKVLGLQHPGESFERIQRGLGKKDPKARASSRELIENLVSPAIRETIVALIEDLSDTERLSRVTTAHKPVIGSEEDLLRELASRDDEVGDMARYHCGEISIVIRSSNMPRRTARSALAELIAGPAATARPADAT